MTRPTHPVAPTADAGLHHGRPLTPEERADFLRRQEADYTARIRRMRDEATLYPELMVTYGFAACPHPPTVGLMAYRDDPERQRHAREIREELAKRATQWRDAE